MSHFGQKLALLLVRNSLGEWRATRRQITHPRNQAACHTAIFESTSQQKRNPQSRIAPKNRRQIPMISARFRSVLYPFFRCLSMPGPFFVLPTLTRKPLRVPSRRDGAGPSFGSLHIFFSRSGNDAKGDVNCLRARDRAASATRWSSDVLPYLGPEIIAVMQAACSSSPNRFAKWPAPSVPWQKRGQNRPVAGLVRQSELLQFKDCECPQGLGLLGPD
jgi:hypothetical protein